MSFSNLWGMFLRSSNRNGCSCPERLHKTRKLRLETLEMRQLLAVDSGFAAIGNSILPDDCGSLDCAISNYSDPQSLAETALVSASLFSDGSENVVYGPLTFEDWQAFVALSESEVAVEPELYESLQTTCLQNHDYSESYSYSQSAGSFANSYNAVVYGPLTFEDWQAFVALSESEVAVEPEIYESLQNFHSQIDDSSESHSCLQNLEDLPDSREHGVITPLDFDAVDSSQNNAENGAMPMSGGGSGDNNTAPVLCGGLDGGSAGSGGKTMVLASDAGLVLDFIATDQDEINGFVIENLTNGCKRQLKLYTYLR